MKRQVFRLSSVLKYYVLQKQRTEYALHEASRLLRQAEEEVVGLGAEIARIAALLGGSAPQLSASGWIACYRKSENLDQYLGAARARRQRQADVVAQLAEQRKRWARAEETLLSLRRALEESNQAEAAKAQQIVLDDAVLRRWLEQDSNNGLGA